jgi:DNA-binding MarR family transcriptional regulator
MAPARRRTAAPAAAEAAPASKVTALIFELMNHVHRRSAGETLAIMNEVGLTMAQLVTLHTLAFGGPRSVSAVADCLRLSPAATSHLIDRLVLSKLVGRTEDPIDRRHKRIDITAAGRTLIDRVQDERAREFSAVLGRLSPAIQRQFAGVLGRVVAELAALPSSAHDSPASPHPSSRPARKGQQHPS